MSMSWGTNLWCENNTWRALFIVHSLILSLALCLGHCVVFGLGSRIRNWNNKIIYIKGKVKVMTGFVCSISKWSMPRTSAPAWCCRPPRTQSHRSPSTCPRTPEHGKKVVRNKIKVKYSTVSSLSHLVSSNVWHCVSCKRKQSASICRKFWQNTWTSRHTESYFVSHLSWK